MKSKPSVFKAKFCRINNLHPHTFDNWVNVERAFIEKWAPKYPQAINKYDIEALEFVSPVQNLMPVKEEGWLKLIEVHNEERTALQ